MRKQLKNPQDTLPFRSKLSTMSSGKLYSAAKKQRIISQQLFDSWKHEVSSMKKINHKIQRNISLKKKELVYVQAVRSRYISQILHKQRSQEKKEIELTRLKYRTMEERYSSQLRLSQIRQKMKEKKKQQSEETKQKLRSLKTLKKAKESQLMETNQSRVKEIENDKARIKEYCHKFFKNKIKNVGLYYNQKMEKEKKRGREYEVQMKCLEEKLVILKDMSSKKSQKLRELDESIESIRQSSQSIGRSLAQSRQNSTRSMTPRQIIISGTGQSSRGEKSKKNNLTLTDSNNSKIEQRDRLETNEKVNLKLLQ